MRKLTNLQHVGQHIKVTYSIGIWRDEQICQGNEGIAQCNKQVNDHTNGGRPSKAPDKIGPLLSYMEEHGVFKLLNTIANPLDLCRFYQTDPQKSNVIMGLKSAASACRIKHLLELAKELGQPLTIVVFEGGVVTPLGLLQELHLRLTLSCIPIHTPEEVKMGQKTGYPAAHLCVCHKKWLCIPQSHHHQPLLEQFFLWEMPGVCASSRHQMKKHFQKCGSPKEACKKVCSKGGKLPGLWGSHKSGHKPKKGKKDKVDKDNKYGTEDDKLCGSPSKFSFKATSQEQVPGTLCHSRHLTRSPSGGGHHKKLKKCGKKKWHRKSH